MKLTRFETGFVNKYFGIVLGCFYHCYYIEEDAHKICLHIKIFNKWMESSNK